MCYIGSRFANFCVKKRFELNHLCSNGQTSSLEQASGASWFRIARFAMSISHHPGADAAESLCFSSSVPVRICHNASYFAAPCCPRRTPSHRSLVPARSVMTSSADAGSENPASQFFAPGAFASLGLSVPLVEALTQMNIVRPTAVQARAIPPLLSGVDVVIGAATGSGKTLAYLLPVIQNLKLAEELRLEGDPALRIKRRPRAVILVPTRELAGQVLGVAKGLSHAVKFRVLGAIGGGGSSIRKTKDLLADSPVDILVATTGRLGQLLKERVIDLRFTTHIVVDEVDTMFDEGFGPELRRILTAARTGRAQMPQCIAAGATHPKGAEEMYAVEFPSAKRIDVDLHRPPPGLTQNFISVTSKTKLAEMVALLGNANEDGSLRGGRIIIFCNTMDSCRFVDHFLVESGYTTSCIHGDVPSARRDKEYAAFRNCQTQLLICTDMAARGLDNLQVDHVVIFDFPTTAVDYIHRAGRTARAGARGRVSSFVMKKDERLARAIEKAAKAKEDALESVRRAREEELRRKQEEEARLREKERMRATAAWSGEQALPFDVPFSQPRGSSRRSTRSTEPPGGRGRRGAGSARRGGPRRHSSARRGK